MELAGFWITGLLATSLLVYGAIGECDIRLKKAMSYSALIWAANMWFHNQFSGAVINLVNFARNRVSLRSPELSFRIRFALAVAFSVILAGLVWVVSELDPYWGFPLAAGLIGTASVLILKGVLSRLALLMCSIIWLSYGLLGSNYFIVLNEVFVTMGFVVGLVRNRGVIK